LRKHRISHVEILKRSRKYSSTTIQSLERVDESVINLKLIAKLVVHLLSQPTPHLDPTYGPGAILIFVPGLSDIRDVIECLKQTPELSSRNKSRWSTRILPLHSSLSSYEQNLVFQIYPANIRKIIVSTNIAETSVTIEDVVYVIDTCRVKENRYDEPSQLNVLDEQWISQANARQRRGRAGRVRSGICYHLACRFTVDEFPDFSVPEMLRMSLEELILQVFHSLICNQSIVGISS
jgi:HrpA-like RNA helicase